MQRESSLGIFVEMLQYKVQFSLFIRLKYKMITTSKRKQQCRVSGPRSAVYWRAPIILEYPFFAHLRRNAPWQRQPRANWKTYLTIIYDTNVSFKGTMHFVNLFPFRIFLPWITPGRFHFALMTSYPIIVHQDWRGSKLGKVYYKICFSFQNIVITFKNTLK